MRLLLCNLVHKMLLLLRSHPSIKSIQHDDTWCISIAISYRSWLTNHSVQFHYKERANPQITDYAFCYKCLQTAIVIIKYAHPKVFIL